jgi:hypothetical protein
VESDEWRVESKLLKVGVECRFLADGMVEVRRVQVDGRWQPVEQGRQWMDEDGRHVLVMLPGDRVYRLTLRYDILGWEMTPLASSGSRLV